MGFAVEYTVRAVKELKKLDKPTRALIYGWIEKNLIGCDNPESVKNFVLLSCNLSLLTEDGI